eukprot:GSChrysophyteH1.ASY1.ANO1.2085.1 assembled CDS
MFRSLKAFSPRLRSELRRFSSSDAVVPFQKILIANRGEIACRVIRTAKSMGIKTVAVYSDADRLAEHSYLVGEKILAACKATGAQAVHPGYGFLSENLDFCEMLTNNGIEFIGPPPDAIRAMGSKKDDHLRVLEALKGFGDESVLIEKLVQAPRHRDCSVQRRHQKVLEEAPAPHLPPNVRKAMGDAAVACAKATGYVGAGTVEFLVDSHPVSELITGVDLVEWQLRIAAGEKLPFDQDTILERASTRGCALEARIYAENPLNDFLPQTGHLHYLRSPIEMSVGGVPVQHTEDGIRVDSGIVSGNDRAEALRMMERALRNYHVAGLSNNIDFLVKIVQHDGFANGKPTTAFFDEHLEGLMQKLTTNPAETFLDVHAALGMTAGSSSSKADVWASGTLGDWRIGSAPNALFSLIDDSGATHEQSVRVVSIVAGAGADHSAEGTVSIHTSHTGATFTVPPAEYTSGDAASGTPMVKAPMPGQVVKCLVSSGDRVKAGDPVCILNAMKMEHVVNAPSDGVVSLACEEGAMVMDGAILAEITEE